MKSQKLDGKEIGAIALGFAALCAEALLQMTNYQNVLLEWLFAICAPIFLFYGGWHWFFGRKANTAHKDAEVINVTIKDKSVTSNNQVGGQTAHTITNTTYQAPSENRDPNSLYQFGVLVGSVQGAVIQPERSAIQFQAVRITTPVDPSREFEYQDWALECQHFPMPKPGFVATYAVAIVGGPPCRIIGKRKRN